MFVVRTLLEYGRHLADTVVQRAKNPNFATIAVYFGTADLSLILARIERGILRATALARVLDDYLAKGRDVKWITLRTPPREPRPARPKAARTDKPAPSSWDDLTSPLTLEEIEAASAAVPSAAPSPTSASTSPSCPASASASSACISSMP